MSFREIGDILLSSIERLLPPQKLHTGRPCSDLRKLMNGILYVINTGCTWEDVPRNFAKRGKYRLRWLQESKRSKISDLVP